MFFIALVAVVQSQNGLFSTLFPQPTGTNGYEEYVRAADLINSAWNAFQVGERQISLATGQSVEDSQNLDPKVDLYTAQSRQVKNFAEVCILVSAGNQKQVRDPRTGYSGKTVFPEIPLFKNIALLESHAASVSFADGRTSTALQYLIDDLVFGRNVSQGIFAARASGAFAESTSFAELDLHRDQLSFADTESLEHLAERELNSPAAGLSCIAVEQQLCQSILADFQASVVSGAKSAVPNSFAARWGGLSKDEFDRQIDGANKQSQSIWSHCKSVLSGPESGWLSNIGPSNSNDSIPTTAAELMSMMGVEDLVRSLIRLEIVKRIQYHLLSVHSKILQYRWRNGKLPTSLDQCVSGSEVNDPIFGGRFDYRPNGETYTLRSKGNSDFGEIELSKSRSASIARLETLP